MSRLVGLLEIRSAGVTLAGGGALDPEGPSAREAADLFWLMLALAAAVFIVFAVVLALGLRRRPRAESGPRVRNPFSRWFVVGGVVAPLIILAVVFAATVETMRAAPTAPRDALTIEIVGHQWWWEVRYPKERLTVRDELHIPVGRPVRLKLRSDDVVHSLWVPALAGKWDLMPDYTNTVVVEADEPGRHRSVCAEFCGLSHTDMRLDVVAEPEGRFAAWVAGRR